MEAKRTIKHRIIKRELKILIKKKGMENITLTWHTDGKIIKDIHRNT